MSKPAERKDSNKKELPVQLNLTKGWSFADQNTFDASVASLLFFESVAATKPSYPAGSATEALFTLNGLLANIKAPDPHYSWRDLLPGPTEIQNGAYYRDSSGKYRVEATTARGRKFFKNAELEDEQSGEVGALAPTSRESATDAPVDSPWTALRDARTLQERANALQHCVHVDPDRTTRFVVDELESTDSPDWIRVLAAMASTLQFRGELRSRASTIIRSAIERLAATEDPDLHEPAWSLMRTYGALIGTADLPSLLPFLHMRGLFDLRQVTLQRIVHLLHAGPAKETEALMPLRDRVYGIANALLNPDVIAPGASASLAINAVNALAALQDKRLDACISNLQLVRAPWLNRQLREKLRSTASNWAKHGVQDPQLTQSIARLT